MRHEHCKPHKLQSLLKEIPTWQGMRTSTKTAMGPQPTKCEIQPKGIASSSRDIHEPVNSRQTAFASDLGEIHPAWQCDPFDP